MSMDSSPAAAAARGRAEPVGPSLFVRVVVRPLTKILNPMIKKLAGGGIPGWPPRSGIPAGGRGGPT